jgi:glycosyltransferase involved in cell wall biosynthesis
VTAPEVTFVMAARNASAYIEASIESAFTQTMPRWEMIVVDDGSTDDTPAIVERIGARDDRVRLIRRASSGGPYAAANEGVAQARGRYIARLDSDDIAVPNRLERQMEIIASHPGARACTSSVILLTDDGLKPFRVRATPTLPGSLKWGLCVRGFLQSTAMIETDAIRAIGGYRQLPVSQDHRMWCELARRGWLVATPEALLHFRVHSKQLSQTRNELQHKLGAEVVVDHLHALGSEWTFDDVYALRSIGQYPVAWSTGRRVVSRFEELWKADASLTAAERTELEVLTKRLRTEHAREAIRAKLRSSAPGRTLLRTYTKLHAR